MDIKRQDLNDLRELRMLLNLFEKTEVAWDRARKNADRKTEYYTNRNLPQEPREPSAPTPPTPPRQPEKERCKPLKFSPLVIFIWPMYLLAQIIVIIATSIKAASVNSSNNKKYKQQLEKYNQQMNDYRKREKQYQEDFANYSKLLREHKTEVAAKKQENRRQYSAEISEENKKADDLKKELDILKSEIRANETLGPKDKDLGVVNYLIDVIENRRADSIKEGLRMMDESARREAERAAKREMDMILAKIERDAQWERDRQQFWHNYEMQNQAKKQADEAKRAADELERIRREIES